MLTIYAPEQTGEATFNRIHLADVVSYSRPMADGTYFCIIRAADGSNPRTLVLTAAQLAAMAQRMAA